MEHLGTRRLETRRLILRRFAPGDGAAMYRNWASDPEVTRYLTWPCHAGPERSEALVRDWVARYGEPDYYQWAIELKALGEPIGSLSVVRFLKDGQCAELGACIGKPWWGQGLVAEALRAVLAYLFDQVGMPEVGACNDVNNPNSARAQEKAGLRWRMTLLGQGTNNQGVCDLDRRSLTREEWAEETRRTAGAI